MHSIIFDKNLGGNFLDWSIFYLSGFKTHWNIEKSDFLPLSETPLTNINSHNHISNQINCEEDILFFFDNVKNLENFSIIFHQVYSFDNIYGKYSWSKNLTSSIIEKVKALQNNKIILLKNTSPNILYNAVDIPRCGEHPHGPFKKIKPEGHNVIDGFINHFFSENYEIWKNQNMENIWDKREFIALNFRPFDTEDRLENNQNNFDYFPINDTNLWTSFDLTVPDLFEFMERSLCQQRFNKWKDIYSEWKRIHIQVLRFCWYFDEIIDAILNNRYINLEVFNLDLVQEATIQHKLMYDYGLNFKTWRLEKFIDTKQLHNLLEPNFHV